MGRKEKTRETVDRLVEQIDLKKMLFTWMQEREKYSGIFVRIKDIPMDPNANLNEQREIVKKYFEGGISAEAQLDLLSRLADLVESLDQWISKGGFLPTSWEWDRGE